MSSLTAAASRSRWAEVTRQEPCRVCGRGDFCRAASDGSFLCRRGPFDGSFEKQDRNGVTFWVGFPNGIAPAASAYEPETGPQPAPPEQLARCYAELLTHLSLSPVHRQQMLARGFTADQVDGLGVKTLDQAGRQVAQRLAEQFPFWESVPGLFLKDGRPSLGGWSGLLIPCRDLQGRIIALRIRADSPDAPRYSWLSSERHGGPGPGSPLSFWPGAGGPDTIRVTEGELKAALAAIKTGVPTIAAPGVGLFGGNKVLDWLLEVGASRVILSPDSDFRTNPHVSRAVGTAIKRLQTIPYPITVETWKPSAKGIDDALQAGLTIQPTTPEEFFTMVQPLPRKTNLTLITGQAASDILDQAEAEEWGDPLPLKHEGSTPFPLDALGDGLFRQYVEDLAEFSQMPAEFPALTCLTMANAMTRKRVRVESGQGRTMPINLHVLLVNSSGDGKSTVFEAAGAPIDEVQRNLRDQSAHEKETRELRCAEIDEILGGLSKDDPSRKALKGEQARLQAVSQCPPKLRSSDPSAEAIEPLLAANQGCLAILNPDAREFLEGVAGSHRNGCANLKPLLSGFSGEDWQIERITRTGSEIRKPFVSMVLMVQASAVKEIAKKTDFAERGALARMLMAWPPPPADIPKSPWERRGMPSGSVDHWSKLIHALSRIDTPLDGDEPVPHVIPMSPGAVNQAKEFFRWSHQISTGEGTLASIPATGKRLAEIAQRVAAALHLIDNILTATAPWETAITAETYSRAVRIVRWSLEAVLEVHFSAGGARTVDPGHVKVWEVIRSLGKPIVKAREVHRKMQHLPEFRTVEPVKDALKTLDEMNYLRLIPPASNQVGRPTEAYQVRDMNRGG